MNRPADKPRLHYLDLLRFIAAASVVLYHFTYRPIVGGKVAEDVFAPLHHLTMYGYMGVNLFFMISGFVILWTSMDRTPSEFVVSRFSRLYPTFWAAIAVTGLAILLLAPFAPAVEHPPLTLKTLILNATMLPGYLGTPYIDGVYWTLAVEIKFYVLVFALMILGLTRRIQAVLVVWLALISIESLWDLPGWAASLIMAPYGAYFLSGCFYYLVMTRGANPLRIVCLLACAANTIAHCIEQRPAFITTPPEISLGVVIAVTIAFHLAFIALLASIKAGKSISARRAWWLYFLGALTYPLYLVHNLTGKLLFNATESLLPLWIRMLFALAVVVALSVVLVKAVDQPARKPAAVFLRKVFKLAHVTR